MEIAYAVYRIYLKKTILEEPIMHAFKFCRQDSSPVVFHFSMFFYIVFVLQVQEKIDFLQAGEKWQRKGVKVHFFVLCIFISDKGKLK